MTTVPQVPALTFNIELIAVILIAILSLYLIAIILGNTYVNLTPKAMGTVSIVWYMLGVLTVAYIVGSATFVYFSLFVVGIFLLKTIFKIRRSNKSKKRTAQQQGGNNV